MFAKLFIFLPDKWKKFVEDEAKHHPEITRTIERIKSRDIKEPWGGKWAKTDRVIAENYFTSKTLKKPLWNCSSDSAVGELEKLGVEITVKEFDRALRRLFLVD